VEVNVFYGWIMLIVLCLVYALGIGPAFYGFGVTLPSTAEALDLTRVEASIAFSLMALLLGLSGPITAVLLRKIGPRFTMVIGSLLLASGAALVALSSSFIGYVVGAGVLMGFGLGFMTVLPGTTLITTWFVRRRALAMGLFLTAGGLGGFAFAILIRSLEESTGTYRSAWWTMVVCALVAGVLILSFVRPSPASMGQFPDGVNPDEVVAEGGKVRAARNYQTPVDWQAAKAMRTVVFWLIVFCNAMFGLGLQVANSQLVAHLTSIGVVAALAASALGTMALVSALSRLLGGFIGDWVEPRFLLGGGLAGQVVGILLLLNATSTVQVYSAVAIFGAGFGFAYLSVPPLVANYFGVTAYPTLFGVVLPVGTIIGASGPLLAGAVFDATGGYGPVFIGFAIAAAVGSVVAFLFIRPPKAPEPAGEGAAAAEVPVGS
jgi:cyanate permease